VEGVSVNGSATGAAEALLQQFLSSAQLVYTNLSDSSRDATTPLPYLQWGPAAAAAAGAENSTAAGSSTRMSSNHQAGFDAGASSRLAVKLPSVALCMEWIGLASLRSVPWIQVTGV
jgi:hypothetical protein